MILRVNPNRMELLRLHRRLVLAKRGHKLLQDKLEEMMRRFLAMLKDIDKMKEDFQRRTSTIVGNLLYSRITSSKADFDMALSNVSPKISVTALIARIMNLKAPRFGIEELKIDKRYDFFKTSAQLDLAIYGAREYIKALLKLAESLKTLDILSYEIERTRRRVNALEYVLIPSIEETIRYIGQKLNELERSSLTRLMRVKELIESR